MAKQKIPSLYDPTMLIQAGIDPKTGLPLKLAQAGTNYINLEQQFHNIDKADALNRYTWYGLPPELSPQLIERVLYYRGQGALFKLQDKFYFLPYALDGTIDVYGRYTGITPLPFNGTANDGDPEKPWIQGLNFKPVYERPNLAEIAEKSPEQIEEMLEKSCVILHDYSPGLSQAIIPRAQLQAPIISFMRDCLPFMRTALLNSTGVLGVKVAGDSEAAEVKQASITINEAALHSEKFVPIIGSIDFQELTGGTVARAEEFLLALQSLDNLRLSMYGLDAGGLFQKRSHMLEAEQEMNTGNAGLVLDDGLKLRQDFCMIVNMIWGDELDEDIWCEVSETVLGIDKDGDGEASTNEEFANSQPIQTEETEDVVDE